jgi:flagellar hook-associated protein 3 FlgL
MRVTDSMVSELARSSVAEARERAVEAQRVASSGVRVGKPSDDPVAASTARRRAAEEARLEAMAKTANSGVFALQLVDATLTQVGQVFDQLRELAVQGANATLNASDRAMLADQVAKLREQAVQIANTQVDGKYVLAGARNDTPPFDATGAFVGDSTARELEVAPGVRVPVSVDTQRAFAPSGGADLFAAASALEAGLRNNDQVAVRQSLDPLNQATTQLSAARGDVGSSNDSLTMAQNLAGALKDRASAEKESLIGADFYDAALELSRTQAVLQQAVAIAAKLPLPGLVQKQ